MSDVRVHRNSAEPAKIGALAHAAQGEIHLGPGQDHHLPHEAWHVVQQKQGRVSETARIGGMSINDDPALEREADVMGPKARHAYPVDTSVISAQRSSTVTAQRITPEDLRTLGGRMEERASQVPETGANLWKAVGPSSDKSVELFLLGTNHGLLVEEMPTQKALAKFLTETHFASVRTEMPEEGFFHATYTDDLAGKIEQAIKAQSDLIDLGKDPGGGTKERLPWIRARSKLDVARLAVGIEKVFEKPLDVAYLRWAATRPADHTTVIGALENAETRKEAHDINKKDNTPDIMTVTEDDADKDKEDVRLGRQQELFREQAKVNKAGIDHAGAEQRNLQWLKMVPEENKHLWIIGAAHLPGLIIRLEDAGWTLSHVTMSGDKQN